MKTLTQSFASRFYAARLNTPYVVSSRANVGLYSVLLGLTLCAAALPARAGQAAPLERSQAAKQAAADDTAVIVRAQGHARHQDFVARSSKRADLRANVQRKGVDVAFTEWLRAEQPHAYREHLAQLARQQQNATNQTGEKVAAN